MSLVHLREGMVWLVSAFCMDMLLYILTQTHVPQQMSCLQGINISQECEESPFDCQLQHEC